MYIYIYVYIYIQYRNLNINEVSSELMKGAVNFLIRRRNVLIFMVCVIHPLAASVLVIALTSLHLAALARLLVASATRFCTRDVFIDR